jgi:hypothetical protein
MAGRQRYTAIEAVGDTEEHYRTWWSVLMEARTGVGESSEVDGWRDTMDTMNITVILFI